jgi:hypothetical protein
MQALKAEKARFGVRLCIRLTLHPSRRGDSWRLHVAEGEFDRLMLNADAISRRGGILMVK